MRIWLYQGQMQRMRVMFLMAGLFLAAGFAAQAGDFGNWKPPWSGALPPGRIPSAISFAGRQAH